jgi:hypothetical protein
VAEFGKGTAKIRGKVNIKSKDAQIPQDEIAYRKRAANRVYWTNVVKFFYQKIYRNQNNGRKVKIIDSIAK